MKKLVFVLILIASTANAADRINCESLVASGTVLAAGTALTIPVSSGSEGYFVVQPTFTGTGTLKIEYQTSTLGDNWSPVVEITASATSATEYRYPESGTSIFSGKQRLIFTETGSANPVTFTEIGRCSQ